MFKRVTSSIFVFSLLILWSTLLYAQIEKELEKTGILEEIRKELEVRKKGLSPFGYDLFNLEPTAFQPDTLYGPVDPGYPVGPGDEVIVNVWGQVEFTYSTLINREGYLTIPKVGPISVNGLILRELQKRVMDRLSRAYSGISRDPARATTFVDVSLGRLKPIRVFIIGEVRRPGGYAVSSVSTVLNALYNAGGPYVGGDLEEIEDRQPVETEIGQALLSIIQALGGIEDRQPVEKPPSHRGPHVRGSLREIKVIRRGRAVTTVDLYDYLLRGDTSREVRLENDDTILVPPIGKTVSLAGRVHRPAIYELKLREGLKELLDIAGGIEPDAYLGKIQIDRIVANRERKVIDVDFAKVLESGEDVELFDGDVVSVFPVLDRRENVVKLRGFVKRPGIYQLREGLTVKDLIQEAHGVWEEAFLGRADIIRTNPDLTKDIIPFHLGKAFNGDEKENLKLERLDEVIVHSIHTFKERESVTILGSVRHHGEYELLSNMTLEDLIVLAGGLTETAYKLRAEISRVDPERVSADRPAEIIYVDISDDYTASGEGHGFKLQNFDTVFIRLNPDWEKQRNVTVSGEVRFPGTYTLKSGAERLSSITERAGGLKETAYPEGIIFMRRKADVNRMMEDLREKIYHGSLTLTRPEGDLADTTRGLIRSYLDSLIFVQKLEKLTGSLEVGGYLDSLMSMQKRELGSATRGPKRGAYLDSLLVLIKREGDVKSLTASLEERTYLDSLISLSMRQKDSVERIAVDLRKALSDKNSRYDVVLSDGDRVIVPRRPETVRVSGEVVFPSVVPYVKGKGVGYYLDRAGGLKETADKDRIRIVLANGKVEKPRRFWFDPEITPGSTIVVPREERPTPQWRSAMKDVLIILSGTAVAIVAIDRLLD